MYTCIAAIDAIRCFDPRLSRQRNFQEAQSKTDSPRVLVSAPSGHGTSGHAPAAANTAAPEPTPGVTRLVARSMQHVQQHVGPGARTQFQQLWKQAAQKARGMTAAACAKCQVRLS